jgi:hypothetical protein
MEAVTNSKVETTQLLTALTEFLAPYRDGAAAARDTRTVASA